MIMWKHYCKVEETSMEIGQGEECNWCGMTEEDAVEYFDYNVQGAWVGEGTPIFLYDERWSDWNE